MGKTIFRKIGLFGGTFDPPHLGHLIIAEHIADEFDLEKVLFIPAKIHPLKDNREIQSAKHRLKMLELATQENPRFSISEIELKAKGTSYTIETIRALKKIYPTEHFKLYFLMGADNINQLYLWKQPEELIQLCTCVAFGRPGFKPADTAKPFLPHIHFVNVPLIEISATEIRSRVRQDKTIRYLAPSAVISYIYQNKLYKNTQ